MTGSTTRPLGFYAFCIAGGVVGLRLLGMLFQSGGSAGETTQETPRAAAPPTSSPLPAVTAAPQPARGPTCADLKPNLPRWGGLLPRDVPAEAAPLLAYRNRQPAPPSPIVTAAGLRFVTEGSNGLQFSGLEAGKLTVLGTVPLPRIGAQQIRVRDFAIASSPVAIAAVVQDYQDVFFFTVDSERWAASPAVKVPSEELPNMGDARAFHFAPGADGWGLVMNVTDGFQFTSLDKKGIPIGKPATIRGHTWVVQPKLVWNGQGFGVLGSRSDDGFGHSLGIWEFADGKEPVYQPIVDAPANPGIGIPVHHVGGWLVWDDGRYHFGVHVSEGSKSKDVLVHFRPGEPPRFDDCKLSEP